MRERDVLLIIIYFVVIVKCIYTKEENTLFCLAAILAAILEKGNLVLEKGNRN